MRRGDVWWANLDPPWGRRPVVLLARDEAYAVLHSVTVAPVTTRNRGIRSWVPLDPAADHVDRPSAVNLDAIHSMPIDRLDSFWFRLGASRMAAVDLALHFALGIRTSP